MNFSKRLLIVLGLLGIFFIIASFTRNSSQELFQAKNKKTRKKIEKKNKNKISLKNKRKMGKLPGGKGYTYLPRSAKKVNIILDIDHTLLHTVTPIELERMNNEGLVSRDLLDSQHVKLNDLSHVFLRPDLQKFLDWLFKNFNVGIWSAGSRDYVHTIVDTFIRKKGRKLDFVLTRDDLIESGNRAKNLKYVWERYPKYTPYNTLLIDDLDDNVFEQVSNAILIPPFIVFNEKCMEDQALLDLKEYLDRIKYSKDVRRIHDPFDNFLGGIMS